MNGERVELIGGPCDGDVVTVDCDPFYVWLRQPPDFGGITRSAEIPPYPPERRVGVYKLGPTMDGMAYYWAGER